MFYQDNKSICASFPVFPSFESNQKLQCAVFTVSQAILWNHFGWLQIGRSFSPPQLYFVVWSSERTCQVHHVTLGLQASLHFMNSPVLIRWWHLVLIALMRWWYQSREGEKMKCLHLSTYTFPSFSTSTFPFPSSLSFHSPSSIPIFPARRGRLTSSYNEGSFKTKWKQPS